MRIKKGDKVKMLYGKDAGKVGVVISVKPKSETIVIEGLNMFKKHVKGDGRKSKSEIVDVLRPVNVAKVMVVCPSCNKPTRVGIKREGGVKSRVCKKCGKNLDVKDSDKNKKTEKKEVKGNKSKKSKK